MIGKIEKLNVPINTLIYEYIDFFEDYVHSFIFFILTR